MLHQDGFGGKIWGGRPSPTLGEKPAGCHGQASWPWKARPHCQRGWQWHPADGLGRATTLRFLINVVGVRGKSPRRDPERVDVTRRRLYYAGMNALVQEVTPVVSEPAKEQLSKDMEWVALEQLRYVVEDERDYQMARGANIRTNINVTMAVVAGLFTLYTKIITDVPAHFRYDLARPSEILLVLLVGTSFGLLVKAQFTCLDALKSLTRKRTQLKTLSRSKWLSMPGQTAEYIFSSITRHVIRLTIETSKSNSERLSRLDRAQEFIRGSIGFALLSALQIAIGQLLIKGM